MSISKLALLNRKPAAADAASFSARTSHRDRTMSAPDAEGPSFDEALQESRAQLTSSRAPASDLKLSRKRSSEEDDKAPDPTKSQDSETPAAATETPENKVDQGDESPAKTKDDGEKPDPKDVCKDASAVVTVQITPLVVPTDATVAAQVSADPVAGSSVKPRMVPIKSPAIAANSQATTTKAAQADSGSQKNGIPVATAPEPPTPPANPDLSNDDSIGPTRKAHPHAPISSDQQPTSADSSKQAETPVMADPTQTAAADAGVASTVPQLTLQVKPEPVEHSSASPLTVAGPSSAAHAAPAEVALPAHESPAAAPEDPMDQLVLGLKSKLDPRTGKAEIRLDPPNLGAVKVSLSLEGGSLTAQFESSSEVVRDLLKSNLDRLKTVLEGHGVAVDRLAVASPPDAQQQGQASFGSATHDGRSAGQYQQDTRRERNTADPEAFAGLFSKAQEAPLDLVA